MTEKKNISTAVRYLPPGAFPMYVTWFKNDEKLPECNDFQYTDHGHGEFSLILNDTFLADSGLYKCEAYNCHGDAVSVGHLIVSGIWILILLLNQICSS